MYKVWNHSLWGERDSIHKSALTLIMDSLFVAATYFYVSFFIFPKNFNLSIPTHSDYYAYYVYSQTEWSINDLLLPRPLFWIYIHILGIFKDPSSYYLGLAIPAFIFIYMLFRLLNQIFPFRNRYLAQVLFYLILFTSSYFFQVFQLDVGGTLAGTFTVISLSALHKSQRNKFESKKLILMSLVFFLFAIETKPLFTILSVSIYIAVGIKFRNKRSIYLAGASLLISILIFLSDKIRGSVWVQSSNSDSPYAVIIDPFENVKLILFYIAKSMNWPLFLITILSILTLMLYRSWNVLMFFALAIPASLGSLSLLVNRPWEMYAWYPRMFFAALNLIAFETFTRKFSDSEFKTRVFIKIVIFQIVLLSAVADVNVGSTQNSWFRYVYSYNSNILESLKEIPGAERALIVGVNGPYHPFKNTNYINLNYPNLRNIKVLLKKSEKAWNDISPQQSNGIYFEELIYSDYTIIYLTNKTGNYIGAIDPKTIRNYKVSLQEDILQCVENFRIKRNVEIKRLRSSKSNCNY